MGYGTEETKTKWGTASWRAIKAKLCSSNPSRATLLLPASVGYDIGVSVDVEATCAPRDYADKSFRPVRTPRDRPRLLSRVRSVNTNIVV